MIRQARLRAQLTQRDLALGLGTSQSHVARWESGSVAPGFDTVIRAARACGLELSYTLANYDENHDLLIETHLKMSPSDRLQSIVDGSKSVTKLRGAAMHLPLPDDFAEAFDPLASVRVLDARHVEYVVIGGVGAALYGSPYLTLDLDICVGQRPPNLARLDEALRDLDARDHEPASIELRERAALRNSIPSREPMGLVTRFGRLDILFVPPGTGGLGDLGRRQTIFNVSGTEIPVASLGDQIRIKQATGRSVDLIPVSTLRKLQERIWLGG